MRSFALILVMAMVVALSGCVTQSSRDWGYVDVPSAQAQVSTTYAPLGTQVPVSVASMQNTVTTTPPAFAQPYMATQNAALPNVARMSYENNHEAFDANTLINAGFLGLGIVNSAFHWDHLARYPHHRWRW